MNLRAIFLALSIVALPGCDQIAGKLGLEDPAAKAAKNEAEGKAVGSACRHSGRAIEDCYSIYSWLPKASIYEGWREMDEYMRENKLETIVPQLPPPEPPGTKKKRVAPVEPEAPTATKESEPATPAADKDNKDTTAEHGKS